MATLRLVTGSDPPTQTNEEVVEQALVALRRCQNTDLPRHAKRALEACAELLELLADFRGHPV